MKILTLEAEAHWGFSVKILGTGKSQASQYLPPPSTLIGAISMPLAKRFGYGEIVTGDTGEFYSAVVKFQKIFAGASCKVLGKGSYWTDINRYIIVMLYNNVKRRLDPNFRFGAIPTGKVYLPNQRIRIAYIIDEDAALEILGEAWSDYLKLAAYEISRVGSKESIVSIEHVEEKNAELISGKANTSFYFPASAAMVTGHGEFFFADYWINEYKFGKRAVIEKYIVPGSRIPVTSSTVEITIKGKGYSDGENLIIVNS